MAIMIATGTDLVQKRLQMGMSEESSLQSARLAVVPVRSCPLTMSSVVTTPSLMVSVEWTFHLRDDVDEDAGAYQTAIRWSIAAARKMWSRSAERPTAVQVTH